MKVVPFLKTSRRYTYFVLIYLHNFCSWVGLLTICSLWDWSTTHSFSRGRTMSRYNGLPVTRLAVENLLSKLFKIFICLLCFYIVPFFEHCWIGLSEIQFWTNTWIEHWIQMIKWVHIVTNLTFLVSYTEWEYPTCALIDVSPSTNTCNNSRL